MATRSSYATARRSRGTTIRRCSWQVWPARTTGGAEAVSAQLGGACNVVAASRDRGLYAFGDFSGLFPLYYACREGLVALSNRSTTAAAAVGRRGWDLNALAWVIGHANLFGGEMPASGVAYLRPGDALHVAPSSATPAVVPAPVSVWPAPAEHRGLDDLAPERWDEVTDTLVGNVRAVGAYGRRIRLMLSGGKDSRLCLALAKAAGLRDQVVTITTGGPGHPEVECAAAAAEAAGFEHKHAGQARPAAHPPAKSATLHAIHWTRLRQHAYRYEAIVCPTDGLTPEARMTVLSVKGFGGELYRGPGGHAKQFKKRMPVNADEMADMFVDYHQKHDPLGVLAREVNDAQAEWLRTWVRTNAAVVRLDVLPEKFYVDYRLGHWNGPLGQNTPGDVKVNPLLSPVAAAAAFELSVRARTMERLHFEVMRRTAPELLGVPFLNDTWSPQLAEASPVPLAPAPWPTVVPATIRSMRPRRWVFLEEQRGEVDALFAEAERHTEMGSICDVATLRKLAAEPSALSNIQVKSVMSCITVALALLGRSLPVRDRL